jgi:hypothetical protein
VPEGGITDGWAIATNTSRGKFTVAGRAFQIRGLTRRQKRDLGDEQLSWTTDADFIIWALSRLKLDTDRKEVSAVLLDDLDDAEVAELTRRLMIQFGFTAPDAAATV